MSDSKQRYLVVPSTILNDVAEVPPQNEGVNVVSWSKLNDQQSQGIVAVQPETDGSFVLRTSVTPDSLYTTYPDGVNTLTVEAAHVGVDGRVIRGGFPDDARFSWLRDGDRESGGQDDRLGWQFRQSPLVAHRACHLLTHSSHKEHENRPWRIQPKFITLANGELRHFSISSARSPVSLWNSGSGNRNFGVPGAWQHEDNLVYMDTMLPYSDGRRLLTKGVVRQVERPVQAYTAACVPGTSDFVEIAISQNSVAVYHQPYNGYRERRAVFGFSPWNTPDLPPSGFCFKDSVVYSCDCAFLPNGRLVLVVAHETAVHSFVSDDMGLTWQRSTVMDLYDTDKDDFLNLDLAAGEGIGRYIRVPKSTTPLPIEGSGQKYPEGGTAGEGEAYANYTRIVASNEHCAISLCVAENGNLVLGLVYPSYRNLMDYNAVIDPLPSSPPPLTTTNTLFSTPVSALSMYVSADGLVWGGSTSHFYDSPVSAEDAMLLLPYIPSAGDLPIVYESGIGTNWPYPRQLDNVFRPWVAEMQPFPAHISLSSGPEGYVDCYISTMMSWMAPYLMFGEKKYSADYTNLYDPFLRLSSGKMLLQHRRFATKTPSGAENMDIWLPTTSDLLTRFHPVQVRSVDFFSNGDLESLGSGGYAGGITAVRWRGATLLSTNTYARTNVSPSDKEGGPEAGDIAVGNTWMEFAAWQPLVEGLGWGAGSLDQTFPVYRGVGGLLDPIAQGRIYGTVWDCGNYPNEIGWAAVVNDSGTGVLGLSNANERGRLITRVVNPTSSGNCYFDLLDALPNQNGSAVSVSDPQGTGLQSVSRVVVKLVSGQFSLKGPTELCYHRLRLRGGGIGEASIDYELRLRLTGTGGADVDYVLYDNIAGTVAITNSASNLVGAQNKWLEFVISTQKRQSKETADVRVYVRVQDEYDPDFESPYAGLTGALTLKTLSTSGDLTDFADYASFGIKNDGYGDSHVEWNYIAIHRPTTATAIFETAEASSVAEVPPLIALSASGSAVLDDHDLFYGRLYSFDFEDEVNNDTAASLLYNNSGVLSGMLGGQLSTTPVWVKNGLHLSAFGKTTARTDFRLDTEGEYSWRNLLTHPNQQEWRGLRISDAGNSFAVGDPTKVIASTITLEIPDDKALRPQALAVFGRNTPEISFFFRHTDGTPVDTWLKASAPSLRGSAYVPTGAPANENDFIPAHYWGHKAAKDGPTLRLERNRVYFFDASGPSPVPYTAFRPNQFDQNDKGPVWYFALQNFSDSFELPKPIRVYRIKTNGAYWLELETDIVEDLDAHAPESYGPAGWNASVYSDRFVLDIEALLNDNFVTSGMPGASINSVTIHFHSVSFRDPDHDFHRCGRIIMGDLIDLSEPDCEWSWSVQAASGNNLYRSTSGPSFSTANSPTVRSFNCAYPLTKPADLPVGAFGVAPGQTSGTWRHKVDILSRLQMDGREAVLVWQGEQLDQGATSQSIVTAPQLLEGYPAPSDPMDVLMVRAGSSYTMQQQQYSGYSITRRDGEVRCVPLPYVAIGGIVFTEDF